MIKRSYKLVVESPILIGKAMACGPGTCQRHRLQSQTTEVSRNELGREEKQGRFDGGAHRELFHSAAISI